jgi:hypothetical protein
MQNRQGYNPQPISSNSSIPLLDPQVSWASASGPPLQTVSEVSGISSNCPRRTQAGVVRTRPPRMIGDPSVLPLIRSSDGAEFSRLPLAASAGFSPRRTSARDRGFDCTVHAG